MQGLPHKNIMCDPRSLRSYHSNPIKTRKGTTVSGCSLSSFGKLLHPRPQDTFIMAGWICIFVLLAQLIFAFTASRFLALPFTALPSGYPFGIPFSLPSRIECFQDIRVKTFLTICPQSEWNLQLFSFLGYPEVIFGDFRLFYLPPYDSTI